MAIWQFNIEFIPKQSLINKYGHVPAELYVDKEAWQNYFENSDLDGDYDFEDAFSIYWWLDLNVFAEELFLLLSQFGSLQEWTKASDGLKSFGDTDTNDISTCYDRETKHVENLSCRLDLRQMDSDFIGKMFSLAKRFDCLLMDRRGRLFEPTLSELANVIKLSNANRFVDNAEQFLNDLSAGNINPE